jgi:hypothetical protein
MDMVIFPVLWSVLQAVTHTAITQWNPLTLQGAGLFHIAMGAVLGIAAFGRTQEKMAGANNGGVQPTAPAGGFPAPSAPSAGFGAAPGGFGSPAPVPTAPAFGAQPLGGNSASSFTPPTSWGTTPIATTASGKKIVPQDDQPVL